MKKILLYTLLIIVGLPLIGIFLLNIFVHLDEMKSSSIGNAVEYIVGNSCNTSGGKWKTDSCGSACGGSIPKDKAERIKNESKPIGSIFDKKICIATCTGPDTYCVCPEGKYFGSIEEGCIPQYTDSK